MYYIILYILTNIYIYIYLHILTNELRMKMLGGSHLAADYTAQNFLKCISELSGEQGVDEGIKCRIEVAHPGKKKGCALDCGHPSFETKCINS